MCAGIDETSMTTRHYASVRSTKFYSKIEKQMDDGGAMMLTPLRKAEVTGSVASSIHVFRHRSKDGSQIAGSKACEALLTRSHKERALWMHRTILLFSTAVEAVQQTCGCLVLPNRDSDVMLGAPSP